MDNIVDSKIFKNFLKNKAVYSKKRIIFPESLDLRILQAVSKCSNMNVAICVLLGDKQSIYNLCKIHNIILNDNIEIINPINIRENYVERLVQIRKHKGMNYDLAKKYLKNNIIVSLMMLESDLVDGLVAGSQYSTSDVLRPAFQIIPISKNFPLVSSIFFMLFPKKVLIYSDCAININPNFNQLSNIAIQSAYTANCFGIKPKIAMLSYYTGPMGSEDSVKKIYKSIDIVRKLKPNLIIDGPLQYDAAVSRDVCKIKYPESLIQGDATILIFPDLNSGNITYKAVQRSSNIVSIGPITQGLLKPVNDLSRGSSIDDIIYTIIVTVIQAG